MVRIFFMFSCHCTDAKQNRNAIKLGIFLFTWALSGNV